MSAPGLIEAAVQKYFTSISNRDLEGVVGLFAEDATVKDPVGTETNKGLTAIRAFYGKSIEMGATLAQQGAARSPTCMPPSRFMPTCRAKKRSRFYVPASAIAT